MAKLGLSIHRSALPLHQCSKSSTQRLETQIREIRYAGTPHVQVSQDRCMICDICLTSKPANHIRTTPSINLHFCIEELHYGSKIPPRNLKALAPLDD